VHRGWIGSVGAAGVRVLCSPVGGIVVTLAFQASGSHKEGVGSAVVAGARQRGISRGAGLLVGHALGANVAAFVGDAAVGLAATNVSFASPATEGMGAWVVAKVAEVGGAGDLVACLLGGRGECRGDHRGGANMWRCRGGATTINLPK